MPTKKDATLLFVTYINRPGEREQVCYSACHYEGTLQLPFQWKLDSVDKFRLKQSKSNSQEKDNGQADGNEGDSSDDTLPEAVQSQIDEAVPSALKIYALYKRTIYCADLKASDVAKKLENGNASVEIAASPVEDGPRQDDMSGMDANGMLVNIEPTSAGSTFKLRGAGPNTQTDSSVSSFPLKLNNRMLSGNLEIEPESAPQTLTQTVNKIWRGQSTQAGGEGGGSGGEGGGGGGDEGIDEDDDDNDEDTNPILQMLGVTVGPNPGIKLDIDINMFPVPPGPFLDIVKWQQGRGWLPRNSFQAAWTLSDLTSARAFRYMLPALILMVLAATWMLLYALVPAARHYGDATVAKAYHSLPKHTQNTAQQIWHLLLPDVILKKIAPGLVSGVFALSLPLLPFVLLFSAPAFSWWFRHIASPASGQGVVYGATIQGSQALSKQKFDDLRAESTARPDLSGGKAGDISEDTQERFWKDAGFDPKAAKKAVEADAQWRSKFGINNILSSKAPNFFTMKKAFPHGILCISKDGCPVFAMKMGVLQEQYDQIEQSGMSNDDIVKHLALVYEYAFATIDPRPLPHGRLINVMDFDGMGIMDMKGKASKLGNLCSKISKYHYPDRLHKALLINCPGMINQMWGIAKNMLDENARQRTHLHTKKDTKKGLLEVMEESDIPKEWGGSREEPFYNGKHEMDLWKRVAKNNGDSIQDYKLEGMFEPPAEGSKSKGK